MTPRKECCTCLTLLGKRTEKETNKQTINQTAGLGNPGAAPNLCYSLTHPGPAPYPTQLGAEELTEVDHVSNAKISWWSHECPFVKIDGTGKWNKTHLNQCPLFLTTLTQKGTPMGAVLWPSHGKNPSGSSNGRCASLATETPAAPSGSRGSPLKHQCLLLSPEQSLGVIHQKKKQIYR